MRFNFIYVLPILIFTALAFAPGAHAKFGCDVAKAMTDPALASNEKFWAQVTELSAAGKYNDENLTKLLLEHGVKVGDAPAHVITSGSMVGPSRRSTYEITSKAAKDVDKLPSNLRAKFNDFLETMEGTGEKSLQNFRTQPGKWNLEKLARNFGNNAYSVRLNSGYRVAFRLDGDGIVSVFDVTKTTTHFN